jgi:hypothetical protein
MNTKNTGNTIREFTIRVSFHKSFIEYYGPNDNDIEYLDYLPEHYLKILFEKFIDDDEFLSENHSQIETINDNDVTISIQCTDNEFNNKINEGFDGIVHLHQCLDVSYGPDKENGTGDLISEVELIDYGPKTDTVH